ncbi:hypothetical protein LOTGIDRAFT_174293 [Lottia gigantea]|uniref:Uncharacterized protein n=1 Tax=Lottia gigantea TaxID=225164 RepID=V4AX72_LOTGI|nr:hypothetical protein LOTGIDRAFT_174293 [Lottia gigantea]ESO98161.1 hypothetical protein LOTGIDRAFT_174293 [Lottia gigantea]
MAVDDLQKLGTGNNMREQKEGGQVEIASRQTIHSGHFMVSRVHDVVSEEFDDVPLETSDDAFDFVTANKETSKTYSFGPKSDHTLAIDASLTKLFECMTLAYSLPQGSKSMFLFPVACYKRMRLLN